jgi:hypothetical protein
LLLAEVLVVLAAVVLADLELKLDFQLYQELLLQ